MDWKTHKKQLLKDPEFKKELGKTRLEYEIARMVILARIKLKMTQKQLAKRLKTRQSVISRVENAQTTVSVSFLSRIADVMNKKVAIELK
ncbi:helix-turn-helix transcriptional regulator [Patescibacteria group bacterium]|nr:helix-turn-helix transcriptional regulator [Patescibacteria group bacterium]